MDEPTSRVLVSVNNSGPRTNCSPRQTRVGEQFIVLSYSGLQLIDLTNNSFPMLRKIINRPIALFDEKLLVVGMHKVVRVHSNETI